jgi:hypothetical protein
MDAPVFLSHGHDRRILKTVQLKQTLSFVQGTRAFFNASESAASISRFTGAFVKSKRGG